MILLLLDVASFELFYAAKACDKIFHILIELFFCNRHINLGRLDALVSEHRTHRFNRYAA